MRCIALILCLCKPSRPRVLNQNLIFWRPLKILSSIVMERRCIVCGQLPKSDHTYPHNKEEAIRWQNMLNFFVPAETLQYYCCVCNKHINQARDKQMDISANNMNDQQPSVTFKESDAVLYFGDTEIQSDSSATSQCRFTQAQLQKKAGCLGSAGAPQQFPRNPQNHNSSHKDTENMENVRLYQTNFQTQHPLEIRRTSGFESSESHLNNPNIFHRDATRTEPKERQQKIEKNATQNPSTPPSRKYPTCFSSSSIAHSITSSIEMQHENQPNRQTEKPVNSLPMQKNAEQNTNGADSSLSRAIFSNIPMKLSGNQFGEQPIKQPQQQQLNQQQMQQYSRNCPFCLNVINCDQNKLCSSQGLKHGCSTNDLSSNVTYRCDSYSTKKVAENAVKPNLDCPSCSRQPPLNVLIMGGSTLPTYCNERSFGEQSSQVSVIRVLESDFTRERAIFPDIDEPAYTICRQPDQKPDDTGQKESQTEVLILGPAQTINDYCKENARSKSPSDRIGMPQQWVEHDPNQTAQTLMRNPTTNGQKTQIDELANLLAQQQQLQLSIQAKLEELQGKSENIKTVPRSFRFDAGALAKPVTLPPSRKVLNPAVRILSSMASRKT